jgi:tetraacyldisaccharide 4'-kinase
MALWPLSAAYGRIAAMRLARARREEVAAPVLCVGNFTVGGEGKTPVAIALVREARRQGLKAGVLSRGYGGSLSHPHLVDAKRDSVRLVGDEPLLLARHAPTAVTPDRAAGARLLLKSGCDFLIMDDGFHSARIHIDYALMVVDAERGLGNGHTIPAGPMRAPLVAQLSHAHAVVRMGGGEAADGVVRMAARAARPVFEARLRPRRPRAFRGRRFLAFAGIGNPEKFFATVEAAGGDVVLKRAFPDHYAFTEEDLRDLSSAARAQGLELVTTAKDAVRLTHAAAAMQEFAKDVNVLEVEAVFLPETTAGKIIRDTLAAWRERALR